MAQHDYVSLSKNNKKNPYKREQAPAPKSSVKFIIILIFLCFAVPSFVYLLWTIKDNNPQQIPVEQQVQTKKDANTKANTKVKLPKPPKEKWSYVEGLKEKEVEVGEYTVTQKGPYKMQCGSFKTEKQANALKAKIAFAGLEAQVSAAQGTTAMWYKVYLGPYSKKRQAEKERHKLKNNNIHGCKIWNWQ